MPGRRACSVCAAKQKSRKRACTRRQKNLINKTEREEKRKFFGFVSVYYCYYWFVCTHRATAAATAAAKKAANITTRQKCDTVMIRLIGTPFFLLHKRSKREKSIVKIENSERTQTKRNKNEICEYVNDKRSQRVAVAPISFSYQNARQSIKAIVWLIIFAFLCVIFRWDIDIVRTIHCVYVQLVDLLHIFALWIREKDKHVHC